MNNLKVKILVCCHKKDVMACGEQFFPIHVGKALHSEVELGIQADDTGDNISKKNASYCELTGMYWAWKNLKNVDVIGLNHYRRYFDYYGQSSKAYESESYPSSRFDELKLLTPKHILKKVLEGGIVTANPISFDANLAYTYCYYHNSADFRALQHVIATTQPEYVKKAFWKVMYQNCRLMPFNMFLMRWDDFDKYCTWLFQILAQVEDITDISDYGPVQRRIYGYMGERLFNVWLVAEKKRLINRPILWINETPASHLPKFKICLTKLKFALGYHFLKGKYIGLDDNWKGTTKE